MIAISNESQRKILLLLAEGDKNQSEIAEKLNLTPSTIVSHTKRLERLGIIDEVHVVTGPFDIIGKVHIPLTRMALLSLKEEVGWHHRG
ncbi:winged helix-turn-helix domain-containing protein [Thermococcus sp. 2319x1]|uniref:winged helix-turn-helix domain-containing protein n=1 Tax=Thermococcus sp. 2319x1 TaxID=1674923 RepID=UPI001E5FB7C5|nr:winged helix-turn-helix domain-containing protein [Thermococcus sp. 2319x1]